MSLLDETTLADVVATAGVRAVAERAGVSPSTVSHHFTSGGGSRATSSRALARAVLERALDSGRDITDATRGAVADMALTAEAPVGQLRDEDLAAVAAANVEQWTGPETRAALTARYLLYAAAGADPEARALLDARDRHLRARLIPAYRVLFDFMGRDWAEGWNEERFAVVSSAMADGFALRQRFDPDLAPAALFGEATVRLFYAISVPRPPAPQNEVPNTAGTTTIRDAGRGGVPLPRRSTLDRHKREATAVAAAELYGKRGWKAITVGSVAAEARVSRATVNAHFGTRFGLAGAIVAPYLPTLDAAIRADDSPSVLTMLHNHLRRLAQFGHDHRGLIAAFLASHHEPAINDRGAAATAPNPAFAVPLHELVTGLVERAPGRFRPTIVEPPERLTVFSIFVTRSTLALAVNNPRYDAETVADFVRDTVIAGAMTRRSALASNQRDDATTR